VFRRRPPWRALHPTRSPPRPAPPRARPPTLRTRGPDPPTGKPARGRLAATAKAAVEADRKKAAEEAAGYVTAALRALGAEGAESKGDIIVGVPPGGGRWALAAGAARAVMASAAAAAAASAAAAAAAAAAAGEVGEAARPPER
jgi:hypothetical protein